VAQSGLDRSGQCSHAAELCADAARLRVSASLQRSMCREIRKQTSGRRLESIMAVWRSRQLRYDRFGPVMAVYREGEAPFEESAGDRALDAVINSVFRLSLILSGISSSVSGPDRRRIRAAIEELDQLIRDIRQSAFERARPSLLDKPQSVTWLAGLRDATSGIDLLLEGGTAPLAVIGLREASQAAHRAIVALGDTG
jgi:hypothetical protein